MNNEESIRALIEGFGAMAEMAKMMFDSYSNAGFTHKDALELTIHGQQLLLSEALKNRGSSE